MSNTATALSPSVQGILTSLLRADFETLIKNRRSFLMGLVVPLALLLVTGANQNAGRGQNRLGTPALIIGLCLTIGLISTSLLGYALSVARDRDAGIFQRLRVTPAPTWTIMGSRLAVQVGANLVIAIVVVVVGAILRHLSLTATQVVLTLVIAVLASAVYLSIGQALVGLVKSAETVNATGRVIYIVLVFFGLLGETGVLGSTVESIAKWSPIGTVMTLFAAALNVSGWGRTELLSVLACVAYAVVFAAIGIRWFQWEAR